MLSTHCYAHLACSLNFEIVFEWKLSLTRQLRQISLAHWATKLLFSLAPEQNLLALGKLSDMGFIPCPVYTKTSIYLGVGESSSV